MSCRWPLIRAVRGVVKGMALVAVLFFAAAASATCVSLPEGKAGWEQITCKAHGALMVSSNWCYPFNQVGAAVRAVIDDQESSRFGGHAVSMIVLAGDVDCGGYSSTECVCSFTRDHLPRRCSVEHADRVFDMGNATIDMRYQQSDRLRSFFLRVVGLCAGAPPLLQLSPTAADEPAFRIDHRIGHFAFENLDIEITPIDGAIVPQACFGIATYATLLPGRASVQIDGVSCAGPAQFVHAYPSERGGLFSRCRGSISNTRINGTMHIRPSAQSSVFQPGTELAWANDAPGRAAAMAAWKTVFSASMTSVPLGGAQCAPVATVIGADVPATWSFLLVNAPPQWSTTSIYTITRSTLVDVPPFVQPCAHDSGRLCVNGNRMMYCIPAFSVFPGQITSPFALDIASTISGVRAIAMPTRLVLVAIIAAAILLLVVVVVIIARALGHGSSTAIVPGDPKADSAANEAKNK